MFTPKDHDLSLPDWGPYSKRYAGASHIADRQLGLRFDLSVFPALYRRRVDVPNVTWESGWHPWESAPSFEYFSFRHELIWKDQLYADLAYFPLPRAAATEAGKADRVSGMLVRCEFVNATTTAVPVALHAMASMNFPTPSNYASELLRRCVPALPSGSATQIKHPLDYTALHFATGAPSDHLVYDGLLRGEIRGQDFLDGSGLGGRFGRNAGDKVDYVFSLSETRDNARLLVRARGDATLRLLLGTQETGSPFTLQPEGFAHHEIPLGRLAAGKHTLSLVIDRPSQQADTQIAFLALGSANEAPVTCTTHEWQPQPERIPVSPTDDAASHQSGPRLILRYPDAPHRHYGIAWHAADYEVRQILNDELDSFLRYKAHDHVSETLRGNGNGHFTNVFIRPLRLAPASKAVVWGMVCEAGSVEAAKEALTEFASMPDADRETVHIQARQRVFTFSSNPQGRPFAFSQARMAATTLTNAVFPVYTQRQHIRHRPPGRWWNSLYTWDSGFIGLGLLEIDPAQAGESLAQYLTAPGNPHAAFIHHGSMVPVQIHLAHEIWNRLGSDTPAGRASLETNYHSLRQYYLFLTGQTGGSTLNNLRSGLLRSWDYFYNSGGWDDYPPQKHVHDHKLSDRITPVITTALAIRCAKTLALAARALKDGTQSHISGYEADIERLSHALERHSWDAGNGCYSYVVHDSDGSPLYPLLHEPSGANYNRGLDGLFPLVAGICSTERAEQFIDKLFDSARHWTPIGLSAVDCSAPYFRHDGYWSGTVWFPHQWYFWKTMLDLGRPELAFQIAQRALETWRAEVDESYHCFEHFLIETGRGCGWHQFSGLSTPVMIFYAACHCPGRLTTGFDAWVLRSEFGEEATRFDGEILFTAPNASRRSVLICLQAGPAYQAAWDGNEILSEELIPGLLAITLPKATTQKTTMSGHLSIRKA